MTLTVTCGVAVPVYFTRDPQIHFPEPGDFTHGPFSESIGDAPPPNDSFQFKITNQCLIDYTGVFSTLRVHLSHRTPAQYDGRLSPAEISRLVVQISKPERLLQRLDDALCRYWITNQQPGARIIEQMVQDGARRFYAWGAPAPNERRAWEAQCSRLLLMRIRTEWKNWRSESRQYLTPRI